MSPGYLASMPWLALPFEQRGGAKHLQDLFAVSGIPSLVLLSPDGTVVTREGVMAVSADPTRFPWQNQQQQTESCGCGHSHGGSTDGRLTSTHVQLLQIGCGQTALAAVKESLAGRLSAQDLNQVYEVLQALQQRVSLLSPSAEIRVPSCSCARATHESTRVDDVAVAHAV